MKMLDFSDWIKIWEKLAGRTCKCCSTPLCGTYFAVILVIGLLGIFHDSLLPAFKQSQVVAAVIFSLTLITSSVYKIMLPSEKNNADLLAAEFGIILILTIIFFALIVKLSSIDKPVSMWGLYVATGLFVLISLFVWIFANADDFEYKGKATGGDPMGTLQGRG